MTQNDSAVVDNLVTQFSSPLHCFRELVQNSIDAGSPTVDVWTEFIEGEGHQGTIALHVDDYGEGMDEALIDEDLTRLFASSKEEDLTKIGQFGIGFVSTFALDPEAILVETGRSGEYWEVLFHEDRSFTKTKLDVPVEGTQITIFLSGDIHRYGELVGDIFKTLKHWCSHSDTEVTFEDRTPADGSRPEMVTVNDPFEVDGECMTTVEHEGTEIVVAYTDDPLYGFYNRGLTLALTKTGDDVLGEERAERFSLIGFKIKSRYLEHTLSRETVMRDANYEKAMKLVEEAVSGPLFDRLIDELEELVGRGDWTLKQMNRYRRLCGFLASEPRERLADIAERPILRMVDGRSATLQQAYEAWKRDGRVLVCEESSELTDRLQADNLPVYLGKFSTGDASFEFAQPITELLTQFIHDRHESGLFNRVRSFFGADLAGEAKAAVASPDRVYMPVVVDDEIPDHVAPLVERAGELLGEIDAGYASLATCIIGTPGGEAPLFVVARSLDSVMARPPNSLAAAEVGKRPHAAVNRDHPHFQKLSELYRNKPNMAAYCLAKSLLLTEDRLLEDDAKLMEAASA
jgi:hypothetical protein